MTTTEWLAQASRDEDRLVQLLRAYHPAARGEKRELPITAGLTEAYVQTVRRSIAEKGGDPVAQFREGLLQGKVGRLMNLLNGAWFGVPESTDCWAVPGFREAVALLEDPPDDECPVDPEAE